MPIAPAAIDPSPADPQPEAELNFVIEAAGGARLSACLRTPEHAPGFAVVIHGATGVPARYYAAFASWLCTAHRAAVLTYDYRDFASSSTGHPRQSKALMSDWGIHDQSAALSDLARRYPDTPLRVIGHSLGALWLGFHDDIARVDRVVSVASGPAYWLNHPISYMPAVIWFWWLGGPLAVTMAGYMPGRITGIGPDLPSGIYWQWRRWCLSREFARGDWGKSLPEPDLTQARFKLTCIGFSDDRLIPPKFAAQLASFYPQAQATLQTLHPSDFGLERIGHTAVFSKHCRTAWPTLVKSLLS
jgi:predicted alpha/beta hydrolase